MFYTRNLYLDAVSEEGGQELFKLFNDYEIQVGIEATSDFVVPRTYEKLKEEISGGGLCFLVRQRTDNAVIGYGCISANWITHTARPMLFIGKEYRGKGYGTQLMALLMYVAFNEVNCRKMAITVYSFNERAIHVYKAAGFKEEGRVPEECYRNGRYWDVVYLGLFRKDYREYFHTLVTTAVQKEGDQTQ